jgi:hypothetical protein
MGGPIKLGGPIADFAKLVGEVISVERAAITFGGARSQA